MDDECRCSVVYYPQAATMNDGRRTTDDMRGTTDDHPPSSVVRRPSSATGLGRLLLALAAVLVPLLIGQQTPATVTQDLGVADLPNVTGLAAPEQGQNGPFR